MPLSTQDFPDRLAAVVFLPGCPWRCTYCHNPELQLHDRCDPLTSWSRLRGLLAKRRRMLDGVVFSGGEPTAHPALARALADVHALGLETALHTGGAFPERLADLLAAGLVDWVGFDVKAPPSDYALVTGVPDSGLRAARGLDALIASGVSYEVRTTVYRPVLDAPRLRRLAAWLGHRGASPLVLQECHDGGVPALRDGFLGRMASELGEWVDVVSVRRGSGPGAAAKVAPAPAAAHPVG